MSRSPGLLGVLSHRITAATTSMGRLSTLPHLMARKSSSRRPGESGGTAILCNQSICVRYTRCLYEIAIANPTTSPTMAEDVFAVAVMTALSMCSFPPISARHFGH